jgi:hypothetical protein
MKIFSHTLTHIFIVQPIRDDEQRRVRKKKVKSKLHKRIEINIVERWHLSGMDGVVKFYSIQLDRIEWITWNITTCIAGAQKKNKLVCRRTNVGWVYLRGDYVWMEWVRNKAWIKLLRCLCVCHSRMCMENQMVFVIMFHMGPAKRKNWNSNKDAPIHL